MYLRPPQSPRLSAFFTRINQEHFDGFLDPPVLRWNHRLRSSAGRFIPGVPRGLHPRRAVIEIASYLCREPAAEAYIQDTLAHEMIHYWLWVRNRPYGHTADFLRKMRLMGVSRYNPAPRVRPFRYVYTCATCQKEFPARKRLGLLACARCCSVHAGGIFDIRFKLLLKTILAPERAMRALAE